METTTPAPIVKHGRYLYRGVSYPRVTSILNVIAKPGIEAWKNKVGPKEADRIADTARVLGTQVHAAAERAASAFPEPYTEPDVELAVFIEPYMNWLGTYVKDIVATERFIYHERLVYAGTADLIADLKDGRRALVDLKTSNSMDGTYRLQCSAYLLALKEMDEPVDCRIILRMPSRNPGQLYIHDLDGDEEDMGGWLSALRLWHWNEEHKDDWKRDAGRLVIQRPSPELWKEFYNYDDENNG